MLIVPKLLIVRLAQATTGERNAVCTLLVMKSINKSGIHIREKYKKRGCEPTWKLNGNERKQVSDLQHQSIKQTENHIIILLRMGLLKFDSSGNYLAASYDEICAYFGVMFAGLSRKRIKPTHAKLGDIILKLAEQQQQEESQHDNFWRKIRYNPGLNEVFKKVVGGGSLRSETILDRQLDILEGRNLDYLDLTEEEKWLIMQHRADFNYNHKSHRAIWGYSEKSNGAVTYTKRKLERLGLCTFSHRKIEMDSTDYTTAKQREKGIAGKWGRVWYTAGQKRGKLTLFLCDSTEFHNHNLTLNEMQLQTLKSQQK